MSRSRVAVLMAQDDNDHAMHRLAQSLGNVTPMIEILDDQTILLPMRGPTRYFGNESEVVGRIVDAAGSIGMGDVSVGVGSSRLAACIAASRGGVHIVPEAEHRAFLANQPVAVFERFAHIDPGVVSLLFRLGLTTVGEVAAVDRTVLADRFGPQGSEVHVLAVGDDIHGVSCEPLPTQCFVESHHETPLADTTLVMNAANELVNLVVERLEPLGLVACRVIAAFATEHGETCSRIWYHPRGFDGPSLAERLRRQVDKWLADGLTSGVTHMSVDVQATEPRRSTQLGLWGEHGQADRAAWSAIDRLVSIAGDAVRVPEWRGGRDPMRQFPFVPARHVALRDPVAAHNRVAPGGVYPGRWTGAIGGIVPTVSVEPQRMVDIVDAHDHAVVVTGRHALSSRPVFVIEGTRRHRIVEYCGPWPVEERWWDATRRRRVARLQCVVESIGVDGGMHAVAWLVVREQGSWWVVGEYG